MRRPGDLPWGCWLRANGSVLENVDGRIWSSVRQAFWEGELGMPPCHGASEQLELMLRALIALDPHRCRQAENRQDLFGGDLAFWRFYHCWLASIGMVGASDCPSMAVSPFDRRLGPEGRSIVMMLEATREPALERLPMPAVIDAVVASMRSADDEAREEALQAFERQVGLRRHVFARERVGRSHLVTLSSTQGGGGARMPVRRVTWSQAFEDAAVRDELFAWLAARVVRWDDWGALAYGSGADVFGRHLLGLRMASRMMGRAS